MAGSTRAMIRSLILPVYLPMTFLVIGRAAPNTDKTTDSTISGTLGRLREGLRGQGFKLSTVGFTIFTLMLLRAARQIIMPFWGDSLGMSPATIGQIMSASAAVELFIFVPAGFILDHSGRKTAASLCTGIFAAGVMMLPLSGGVYGFLLLGLVIGVNKP